MAWVNLNNVFVPRAEYEDTVGSLQDSISQDPVVTAGPGLDLNDFTHTGVWFFQTEDSPSNIPEGVNGWLVVLSGPDNTAKQIWLRYGTNGSNDYNTWVRTLFSNSGWSPWHQIC